MNSESNVKWCPQCKTHKAFADFSKDRNKKNGLGSCCAECKRARNRRWALSERGHKLQRENQRMRYESPEYRAKAAERRRRLRATEVPQPRDPVKESARRKLRYAVRQGTVVKPTTCQDCGVGGVLHGHHHDYSKPLDVEWLCAMCHGNRHRIPDEGATP